MTQLCPPLCDPTDCSMVGLPVPYHLPEFEEFHVHFIGDTIQPSHRLTPSSALNFSQHQGLSNELFVRIRWPKYWSFSFNISPSSEYSGLISLKIDWFDLLAVQRTFRSLLQHYSLKALVLWCSAFFMVQLSQPYVTTGKTIGLTIWTFVGRIISLLFNTLPRFVIAFLPRSNYLLTLWLQSLSVVILEPKKRNFITLPTFSPSICHAVMGPDLVILVFFIFSHKPALSLSSFTLVKRLSSSSLLSAIRVVSSDSLRLLIFLPPMLIPACNSSTLAFLMMCSVYRLNKQGDSRQPCHTPFSVLNQSAVPYRVGTVAFDSHTGFSGDR